MPMTDPIADLLTRVRNAQQAKRPTVSAPYSGVKFALAKIMEREGYVEKTETAGEGIERQLVLTLKYEEGKGFIRELKRVSKPGRRVYAKASALPHVYSGLGIAVISTPNGLMTNKEARARRLGGEVICELF